MRCRPQLLPPVAKMILRLVTAVTLWAFMNATPAATYSYPAASEEMYAFELLNSERSRCGFGSLRPSAELDSAAKSHAAWLFFNNATGHMQRPGTPGFTGVAPWDRLITANYGPDYSFESTEVQVFHNSTERGSGANAVRSLLNAPYHLVNMLRGYREVGIGVKEKIDLGLGNNNQNIVNIVLAEKNSEGFQVEKAASVRNYPCEGSVGMVRSLRNETPNPFPERDLFAHPVGASIAVVASVGSILAISSVSVVNAKTGATVPILAPVTGSTDRNARADNKIVEDNEGFISTSSPLEANTPYQVTLIGTTGGTNFSRSFTFTTGDIKF
jgi:uncharacterized protein YkwD